MKVVFVQSVAEARVWGYDHRRRSGNNEQVTQLD